MCGEGRGHATRVQTIVEMLVPQYRFILLAPRDAYEQLYARFDNHPHVSVRRLPGLFFAYRNNKVDYFRSILSSIPFLLKLNAAVRYIVRMIERDNPILAITDFEPLLPRAAKKCKVPWISFDHQHFISASDSKALSFNLRWRISLLRSAVPLFYRGQRGEAISSFAHLPPRTGTESICRLGVMLRDDFIRAKMNVTNESYLLVYIRKHAPKLFWDAIEKSGRRAIVYGLGSNPPVAEDLPNRIVFKNIADEEFVRDLSRCECLITTAGNQLIGEAYFLGKPVLAIPEDGNFEQQLNGWLVANSGGGWATTFVDFNPHILQQFLVALPMLRLSLSDDQKKSQVYGNDAAIEFIRAYLPATYSDTHAEPFSGRYLESEGKELKI
jgi:uncharacterized protein (TIGR00661 family)